MFKENNFLEICTGIACITGAICILMVTIGFIACNVTDSNSQQKQIEELKQNNAQLQEETEYYINYSKKLENMLIDAGVVVDNCECY